MEDDDFDFGGFETAEPVAPSQAGPPVIPGIQATPSPWAVFPGGVSSQPDLIQTQKPLQPKPEPPFPQDEYDATLATPGGADKKQYGRSSDGTNSAFGEPFPDAVSSNGQAALFDADFDQMFPASPSKSAPTTGTSDESDNTTTTGPADKTMPDAVRDVTGKTQTSSQSSEVKPDVTPESRSVRRNSSELSSKAVESNDLDLDIVTAKPKKSLSGAETGAIPKTVNAGSKAGKPAAVKDVQPGQVEELQKRLTKTQQQKDQLQKDLSDTVSRNRTLETELSHSVKKLSEQMQTYEQLQNKHKEELAEIRKSSNSALAVIVEEYKELVKTAVLEQQKSSEKQIKEILNREAEKQEKKIQEQHDKFSELLEQERSSLKEKLEQELQQQVAKQQDQLSEQMEKERQNISQQIEESLKEERLVSAKAVSVAVEAERSKSTELLKRQQEEFKKTIEAEEKKGREMLKTAIQEEKDQSQELVRKAILEEQSKTRKLMEDVVAQSREETKKYLHEQKQAEMSLRRKSLASVELFLESAKKQIGFLLEDSSTNEEAEPP